VSEHCSAPVHVPYPRRFATPALRSPSHDVCCLSNLPAHHSPLSCWQSGFVRQARLPRLAHMTNLVEPCDTTYAWLPRIYARSCLSLSTSCTQSCCFLFINMQTPYAPLSHVPMRCVCACAACTRAPRRAARSSRLLPRAHAPGHFQSSATHDRARADQCAITISACVPSHPPGRVSQPPRLCAYTPVPLLGWC
jgi:hypothetical protein